jgi:DNA-binding LacI/PurR family transcriptional regulator
MLMGRSKSRMAVDDVALHFRRHYLPRCAPPAPWITGFDDSAAVEPGLESLTTFRLPCEDMGRLAVRQFLKPLNSFQQPLYERVRGTLVVRD